MRISSRFTVALLLVTSLPALATVFATVHGVAHDPQHRPIANAKVTLQAADSAFTLNGRRRCIRNNSDAHRCLSFAGWRHRIRDSH